MRRTPSPLVPAVLLCLPTLALAAEPVSLRASNITSADVRSTVAPALPAPSVGDSAPPVSFLEAARAALARGRTGETQEALERAETRLLDRSADPREVGRPDTHAPVVEIGIARSSLALRDQAGAARAIDNAIAALATPSDRPVAQRAPAAGPLPLTAPAQTNLAVAVPAALPPSETHALLPGRWELHGTKYRWLPPETQLRQVEDRPFVEGHYVYRDRAWNWVPAQYGGG